MELKITKEKVLEAAKGCPSANGVLKTLFPDAFKPVTLKANEMDNIVCDENGSIVLDFSFYGKYGKASLRNGNYTYELSDKYLTITRK